MKISKFASAFVAVSLTFFGNVNAASFDCTKATTPLEKTICGSSKLSEIDEKLAEAYKSARTASQDPAKLKSEQIEWIKEARKCQSDANCIERVYGARLSELNPQPAKSIQEPVAASPVPIAASAEQQASASQPAASAIETVPAAAVASAEAISPTPVAAEATVASVDSKPSIFSNSAYQKYALIAGGVVLALIAAYFIIKFLILVAKKAAEKASLAARAGVSSMSEKSENLKSNLDAKSKEISEKAGNKMKELSEYANATKSKLASDFNKEGGHKDFAQSKAKEIYSTLAPKIKLGFQVYVVLFKQSPWIVGFITLLAISFVFGIKGGSSSDDSDPVKNEYIVRCWNYEKARQECAAATNVSQCITIKTSVLDYNMANIYCNGSTPNWSLLGKTP